MTKKKERMMKNSWKSNEKKKEFVWKIWKVDIDKENVRKISHDAMTLFVQWEKTTLKKLPNMTKTFYSVQSSENNERNKKNAKIS